jgi:hypothetical protein
VFDRHRRLISLLAATAAASLAPAAVVAQGFPDKDTREIGSYVLTDPGLAKYTQATHNLAALAKKPGNDCEDSEGAQSLDEAVAMFDAIPGAKAAIKASGMTTREYIVFTWSAAQNGIAAWALDQPGAKPTPGISMANVNFYRKHEAAFKKLGEETQAADCDADDQADDGSQN